LQVGNVVIVHGPLRVESTITWNVRIDLVNGIDSVENDSSTVLVDEMSTITIDRDLV
jgi:hypothetical protein